MSESLHETFTHGVQDSIKTCTQFSPQNLFVNKKHTKYPRSNKHNAKHAGQTTKKGTKFNMMM